MALEERLVDTREAATFVGCTRAALALWRKQRRGPSYVRVGRLVRYRPADLNSWVQSRRVKLDGQNPQPHQ
jgi:predicted DNA-binding transcriptional regulator AlpA